MHAPNRVLHAVYLAGPDVFRPDAQAHAARAKALCAEAGLIGLHPFDGDVPPGLESRALGLAISAANERLIARADALIANIAPYHGPSCDIGTGFEIGYARARGLPIFAYTDRPADFTARVVAFLGGETRVRRRADGSREDETGMQIEEFGLLDNLMLDGAVEASGGRILVAPAADDAGLKAAIAACAAWFDARA